MPLDGDTTANYMQVMRERGWTWTQLADDFARQAQQPALDGGVGMQALERWARSEAAAADLRAATSPTGRPEDTPPPADPRSGPEPRKVVPPKKRTA